MFSPFQRKKFKSILKDRDLSQITNLDYLGKTYYGFVQQYKYVFELCFSSWVVTHRNIYRKLESWM